MAAAYDGMKYPTAVLCDAIGKTPQAALINDNDRDRWIEQVLHNERYRLDIEKPEDDLLSRALWHVSRLWGIGGSEIGILIAHREGQTHPFTTAREVIAGKLCKAAPDPTAGPLLRGTFNEPLVRRLFHGRYGTTTDVASFQKLETAQPDSQHPWQQGNPDDVVCMDHRRYVVDYKVPSPDQYKVVQSIGISLDYAAQLHNYAMLLQRADVQIDGMILAPMDTNTMRVQPLECPWDQDLADAILETGDFFWQEYVLKARLPDYLPRPKGDEFLPDPAILEAADQASFYKALAKHAGDQEAQIQAEIKQRALDSGMQGDGSMKAGVMTIASRGQDNYDSVRLVELAEAHGIDLTPYLKKLTVTYAEDGQVEKQKQEYDNPRLYQALLATQDPKINPAELKLTETQYSIRYPASNHKNRTAQVFHAIVGGARAVIEMGLPALADEKERALKASGAEQDADAVLEPGSHPQEQARKSDAKDDSAVTSQTAPQPAAPPERPRETGQQIPADPAPAPNTPETTPTAMPPMPPMPSTQAAGTRPSEPTHALPRAPHTTPDGQAEAIEATEAIEKIEVNNGNEVNEQAGANRDIAPHSESPQPEPGQKPGGFSPSLI